MSLDDKLPTVNWPEAPGEYKVVQILIDGDPHILLEPKGSAIHSVMMKHLAEQLGRDCELERRTDSSHSFYVVKPESDWYKVIGMGTALIDPDAKYAQFRGASSDYGIAISEEHLAAIRPLVPGWTLEKL